MKLYRVCYSNESDSSQGFSWHGNKKQAQEKLKEYKLLEGDNFDAGRSTVDVFDNIVISKKGILDLLNIVATYPENG